MMFRSDRVDATWLKTVLVLGCAALFTVAVLGWARPFDFTFIQSGLDPSWIAASSWASRKGLVFGTDFVFTSGPLSILYQRQFDRALAPFTIAIWLTYAALFGLVLSRLAINGRASWLGIAACLVVTLGVLNLRPDYERDSLMFLACALLVLNADSSAKPTLIDFLLAVILAGFALAKFSIFPLAVLSAVIADLLYILKRRWPLCSATFVASVLTLFSLTGGPLSAFPAFLMASFDVASGYTAAMSITGSMREVGGWLASTLTLFLAAIFTLRRFLSVSLFLVAMALAGILWFGFKAGFVRHDMHSMIAWNVLAGVAWLLALRFGRQSSALFATGSGLAIAALVCAHSLIGFQHPGYVWAKSAHVWQGMAQIETGLKFARTPNAWLNARQDEQDTSMARVRAAAPLPTLLGTIDVLPSVQSDVIANGLSYHPRPTVQEYTSYTSGLITRNRAFFEREGAPKYLLFQPGSIDGRHPASTEGPLWPLFMSRYEPIELVGDYVLLRRRAQAVMVQALEPKVIETAFEAWTPFPAHREVSLVSIDAKPNALGKLAAILFKLPILTFEIVNDDGAVTPFRLIPEIQRLGTILAPLVQTPEQYGMLVTGLDLTWQGSWPTRIRVTGERLHRFFYEPGLTLTFTSLDRTQLKRATENTTLTRTLIDRMQNLQAALSILKSAPPMLAPSPEGIFAHAPARISVPVSGAQRILVGFGIRNGAYAAAGQSDGVCFAIKQASTQQTLFERCLDPVSQMADRGTIAAEVRLPEGVEQIIAETSCRASCAWDWSYWSMLRPSGRP